MPRIVDVHSHLYPEAYLNLLQRVVKNDSTAWGRAAQSLLDGGFRSHPAMTDISAHIDDMDANGVTVHALSLSTPMAYFADEKDAVEAAHIFNDSVAEVIAKYPGRFKGFASLPLPHTDASLKEMDRAINTLGLHGIGLGANAQHAKAQLDDPRILPIFPEINRQKLTIFLHPALPPGIEELMEYDLWVSTGFLVDSLYATLRLANAGVFAQNPDMNFIVPHIGTFLLAGIDRVAGANRFPVSGTPDGQAPKSIKEHCQDLYYDSILNNAAMWDCAVETVGLDHIVYGTDYPFGGGAGMGRRVKAIMDLKIADAEKEMILSGTADRLLRA